MAATVLAVLAAVLFPPVQVQTPAVADPTVAALLAQVDTATLMNYANQLSGETPATVGGAPYTFTTRHSESGAPITKATQFAYEYQGYFTNFVKAAVGASAMLAGLANAPTPKPAPTVGPY